MPGNPLPLFLTKGRLPLDMVAFRVSLKGNHPLRNEITDQEKLTSFFYPESDSSMLSSMPFHQQYKWKGTGQ